MTRPRARGRRPGYAMVAVVLFVVLFLGLWSLAARQVGSLLRVEQARARRVARDTLSLPGRAALAKGLAALEAGYPPSSPFACQVDANGTAFSLTFSIDPAGPDSTAWLLQASLDPDPSLPPLDPSQFGPSPP